jgi:hypothetical protein
MCVTTAPQLRVEMTTAKYGIHLPSTVRDNTYESGLSGAANRHMDCPGDTPLWLFELRSKSYQANLTYILRRGLAYFNLYREVIPSLPGSSALSLETHDVICLPSIRLRSEVRLCPTVRPQRYLPQ